MKTTFRLLFIMVFFVSCASRNVFREKGMAIDKQLDFTLANSSSDTDFLLLFGITEKVKTVRIRFDVTGDFRVEYKSNFLGRDGFRTFSGKFRKNYYEIYLAKKKLLLPPVYCKTNIERIRITISNDSILNVDKYWDRSGMVLLFAAGGSGRKQYAYNKSKS